jgi:hypothetical protein
MSDTNARPEGKPFRLGNYFSDLLGRSCFDDAALGSSVCFIEMLHLLCCTAVRQHSERYDLSAHEWQST